MFSVIDIIFLIEFSKTGNIETAIGTTYATM